MVDDEWYQVACGVRAVCDAEPSHLCELESHQHPLSLDDSYKTPPSSPSPATANKQQAHPGHHLHPLWHR